jgi:tryptophan synthase alpha chain
MELISMRGSGFVYYVSLAGVTGARKTLSANIARAVKRVRSFTDLPVSVGFGISTPAQAARVARIADGVVVGSAIINVIKSHSKSGDLAKRVGRFAAGLKRAVRST